MEATIIWSTQFNSFLQPTAGNDPTDWLQPGTSKYDVLNSINHTVQHVFELYNPDERTVRDIGISEARLNALPDVFWGNLTTTAADQNGTLNQTDLIGYIESMNAIYLTVQNFLYASLDPGAHNYVHMQSNASESPFDFQMKIFYKNGTRWTLIVRTLAPDPNVRAYVLTDPCR